MGDDERQRVHLPLCVEPAAGGRRAGRGINPLDDGMLYVAKFNADGTGEWLPLTPDNPALAGWSLNDILINTRGAADAVGATKMDRPEWIDTFPESLTAIATLTNNNRRGTTQLRQQPDGSTAGSAAAARGRVNPRVNNVYGHIIPWKYDNDWTEPTFEWDIFALGGDPAIPAHGSTIVGDKYGSPDGHLRGAERQALDPDRRVDLDDQRGRLCRLRQQPDAVRRSRRPARLAGSWSAPSQCEITGVFVTPDERTMFVGIQHPGETPDDSAATTRPIRSSSAPGPTAPTGGRPRSSLHRDHEGRRRPDRQLKTESRGSSDTFQLRGRARRP